MIYRIGVIYTTCDHVDVIELTYVSCAFVCKVRCFDAQLYT
jgi:hypothetical protein